MFKVLWAAVDVKNVAVILALQINLTLVFFVVSATKLGLRHDWRPQLRQNVWVMITKCVEAVAHVGEEVCASHGMVWQALQRERRRSSRTKCCFGVFLRQLLRLQGLAERLLKVTWIVYHLHYNSNNNFSYSA